MPNFFICYMAVGLVMFIGLLLEDAGSTVRKANDWPGVATLVSTVVVVLICCLLAWPLVTWYDYNAKESARHG